MNDQDAQLLLSQLETVHLPQVSHFPAPGWWVLLVVGGVIAFSLYHWRKRFKAQQWRREARAELHRLREQIERQPVADTLAETSRLARRILMAIKGRESVASLHGKPWLEALDSVCEQPVFANGFGQLLETGPYQRDPQVSERDLEALLDAMESLIRGIDRVKQ